MENYTVKILNPDFYAVKIMSSILMEEHIFKNLCGTHKSLFSLYTILRKVETGLTRVIAAFDEKNKVIGVCYGFFDENRRWINHSAFSRGVDAVKITRDIEAIIVMNVPDLGHLSGIFRKPTAQPCYTPRD